MNRTIQAAAGVDLEEKEDGETHGPYKQPLEKYDLFTPPGAPFPAWLAGTLVPVIRTASNSRKKMHAPDFDAEEVGIACWNVDATDATLYVSELSFAEGWEKPCRCAPCRRGFARMGLDVYDDLDVVLPEWADEFETPAVATRAGKQDTAHAPANTGHPYPACGVKGEEGPEWVSVELEEENDITRCQNTCCQETFAWMDSQNQVVNTRI